MFSVWRQPPANTVWRSAAFKFLGTTNDDLGSHECNILAASKDSQSTMRARTKIRFTRLARWFLAEPLLPFHDGASEFARF